MVRALVVDDSRIMRMVIRGHLRQCGLLDADIVEAENGQEALDSMGKDPVDLVLSDVNMPIMDGEQLLTWLAQDGFIDGGGRAVMVTSRYERHLFRRLLHTGATTIIRKPFTLDTFLRRLEPVLQEISDHKGLPSPLTRRPESPAAPKGTAPPPTAAADVDDDVGVEPTAPQHDSTPPDEITAILDPGSPREVLTEATLHALKKAGVDARRVAVDAVMDERLYLAEIETADGLVGMFADVEACDIIGTQLTHMVPSDDELRKDTVGELANIVVGVWQSRLGKETPFSTPRATIIESAQVVWDGLCGIRLDDGGRVYVSMLT